MRMPLEDILPFTLGLPIVYFPPPDGLQTFRLPAWHLLAFEVALPAQLLISGFSVNTWLLALPRLAVVASDFLLSLSPLDAGPDFL